LASARLDRYDLLGLDSKSEIAAYQSAIFTCPKDKVVVLQRNTPDSVYLPLRRSYAHVTRQYPEKGTLWAVSISMDHFGGGIRSGRLEIFKRSGDDIGPTRFVPFRFVGRHGRVYWQALATTALPVSAESDLLVDVAGAVSRPGFVDTSSNVIDAMRKRGIRAVMGSTFKKDEDYVATGFIRIERPFVRWFTKDHALVTLSTYFRPKGGDVTYSSGGPYDLRWIKGKLRLKCLADQWAGE